MTIRTQSGGRTAALTLAALAALTCAVLAVRCLRLQADLGAERRRLDDAKNQTVQATFDRLALPPNQKIAVCNRSGSDITVSALTAVYIDAEGKPETFNSASDRWRTWTVPAGATRNLDAAGDAGWDGSAVFYAMDTTGGGQERLLTGTSADLKNGCIELASGKTARGD